MVRLGYPEDANNFYMTDDSEVIFKLHQANCQPMWKDGACLYFKKNNKLKKVLAKLNIDLDE